MTYRQILQAIVTDRFESRDAAYRAIDEAFEAGTISVRESRLLEAALG